MKALSTIIAVICSIFIISGVAFADSSSSASASSDQTASAATNIGDIGSNNHSESLRWYAPAGEMNYPVGPNMFGGATPSYMDRLKVRDMLEYDPDGITVREAMLMRKDDAFMGKRIMVREKFGNLNKAQRAPIDDRIKVVFKKQEGMQSLGTITVVSDDMKSVTPDVFAEVIVRAHMLGGTVVHVKAEGFQRLARNQSRGVGFTWTGSAMSGPQATSMTGVLGAGHSWGEAGYFDHPFIIVHVLADENIKFEQGKDTLENIKIILKD